MTDTLVWFALICSVLGTGVTAWTSSGVGRLHPLDARELRRQQRFEDILSLHVEETRPPRMSLPAVAPEAVGTAARDACGSSSVHL
ncbi:hypothetical protein ACFY15_24765 [Streptomyces sp. NPDC001373]|uniref:hypothetical protein n=1 Tax=Streptomyces sp. NPDC001373 TaxID=3364565 RepID=UPI0036B085D8